MQKQGDFLVDNKFTFEVGSKWKSKKYWSNKFLGNKGRSRISFGE